MKVSNNTNCSDLNVVVRPDRGAWLWRLVTWCHGAGIIGAAATRSEAVGEARAAVDELATRCRVAAPAHERRFTVQEQ